MVVLPQLTRHAVLQAAAATSRGFLQLQIPVLKSWQECRVVVGLSDLHSPALLPDLPGVIPAGNGCPGFCLPDQTTANMTRGVRKLFTTSQNIFIGQEPEK